jgi:hypothetical protein
MSDLFGDILEPSDLHVLLPRVAEVEPATRSSITACSLPSRASCGISNVAAVAPARKELVVGFCNFPPADQLPNASTITRAHAPEKLGKGAVIRFSEHPTSRI